MDFVCKNIFKKFISKQKVFRKKILRIALRLVYAENNCFQMVDLLRKSPPCQQLINIDFDQHIIEM